MAGFWRVFRRGTRGWLALACVVGLVVPGSVSAEATSTGTAKVGDRVWVDGNADGVQDAAEAGLSGVKVQLWAVPEKVLVATKVTTSGGWYSFTGLQANRCYRLKVVIPAGFRATKQGATVDRLDSDINEGGTMPRWVCPGWGSVARTGWDAGLVSNGSVDPLPPAVITGLFFEDLNGNNVLDAGEPGVSGVSADFLWGPSDICSEWPFAGPDCVPVNLGESASTGPDGRFRFELDFNGRPDTFGCHNILSGGKVVTTELLFSRTRPLWTRDQLGYTSQNGQTTNAFPCFHPGETWESAPTPLMRPAP